MSRVVAHPSSSVLWFCLEVVLGLLLSTESVLNFFKMLLANIPGKKKAVAVDELGVQHEAKVPGGKRPKASGETRILKDGAGAAEDGLIAALDVRVGLVDPRR